MPAPGVVQQPAPVASPAPKQQAAPVALSRRFIDPSRCPENLEDAPLADPRQRPTSGLRYERTEGGGALLREGGLSISLYSLPEDQDFGHALVGVVHADSEHTS
eukprot:6858618-Alexandrium_andersonii.AAC.1